MVLEITLRVTGLVFLFRHQEKHGVFFNKEDAYRIVCLGDSFTYGLGAEPADSYPAQLERMLNDKHGKSTCAVINAGILGSNSSSIVLEKLYYYVDTYNPDMILLMMGGNNSWMFSKEALAYLNDFNDRDFLGATLKKANTFASSLKIYKLSKALWFYCRHREIINAAETGLITVTAGKQSQRNSFRKIDADVNEYLNDCFIQKKYGLAKEKIKEAVRDPQFVSVVFNLGTVINVLNWATKENSGALKKEIGEINEIVRACYDQKTSQTIEWILDALVSLRSDTEVPFRILKEDITKVYFLAKVRKIRLILMTYPHWECGINKDIREISASLRIPLIDNEKLFREKIDAKDLGKFFVADGHCNARGYRFMATNIYGRINRLIVFPKDGKEIAAGPNELLYN